MKLVMMRSIGWSLSRLQHSLNEMRNDDDDDDDDCDDDAK